MKTIQFFEDNKMWYATLTAMASWENINRTGHLYKISHTELLSLVREHFSPSYSCNLEDPGEVHQMVLYAFRMYELQKAAS